MLNHHPILILFVAAIIAPLLAQTRPCSRAPVVVFDVLPRILIGPHVLAMINCGPFLSQIRTIGMVAQSSWCRCPKIVEGKGSRWNRRDKSACNGQPERRNFLQARKSESRRFQSQSLTNHEITA